MYKRQALLYDLIRYHITNLKPQQCLFFCEVQIIVQMSEVVMRKRYALMQLFQKMIQLHLIRIPAPQKENIQRALPDVYKRQSLHRKRIPECRRPARASDESASASRPAPRR